MIEIIKIASIVFLVVIGVVLIAASLHSLWMDNEIEREEFGDQDKPFFKQQVHIGSPFQARTPVPRWHAWLGALTPFLILLLIYLFAN